jgi:hypothetical protein
MIDPNLLIYEKAGNMCVADLFDRKPWSKLGVRRLMRATGLSQTTVYKIVMHPVDLDSQGLVFS